VRLQHTLFSFFHHWEKDRFSGKRMEIFFLDAEKGEIFFHPLFHGNQLILFRGKTFSVWKRVSFSAEKYPFSMEKDE